MNPHRFTQSLRNALRGLGFVFRHEQNFRIQLVVASIVVAASAVLEVERADRITLYLLILAVLSLELTNSAFEWLLDLVKPRLHDQVAEIKDIMAAAVLLVSAGAAVIGVIIFWPYFLHVISQIKN